MLELHSCRSLSLGLCQVSSFKKDECIDMTLSGLKATVSVTAVQDSTTCPLNTCYVHLGEESQEGGTASLGHGLAQEKGWRQKRFLAKSGLEKLLSSLPMTRSGGN